MRPLARLVITIVVTHGTHVHPSGKPCSLSHSVGVSLLTVESLGSEGMGDEVSRLGLVVVGSSAFPVESLDSAAFSEEGSSRLRALACLKIPAAAFGLKENLGGTSASSTSGKDEYAPPPLGHSEVPAIQHSPGEVVKPEVAEDAADHRELGAVVLIEKASGLSAAATRTAPRTLGSISALGLAVSKQATAIISSGAAAQRTPSSAMES
jgi:hypothetical protein